MYPLKFHPFLKRYPYGGTRFVDVLEKDGVPRGEEVAEAWEISDHGAEQSTVANGPLVGRTLRALMEEFGGALVGEEVFARYGQYFPLLLKFLDCDKRLPAHLHPSDEDAGRLGMSDTGKTEAWYIVRAEPGAAAYSGPLLGMTPDLFQAAITKGDPYDGVMNRVQTTTGDTYFVPAGRPHALDAGNLAFEIQQNSDAGFGWEWAGFVEAGVIPAEDARRHPQLAIDVALYETGTQESTVPVSIDEGPLKRTFCAACKYFVLENLIASEAINFRDAAARFNTLTIINGGATVRGGGEEVFVRRGDSLLIPAGLEVQIAPQSGTNAGAVEMLRCYVPNLLRDVVQVLGDRGFSPLQIAGLGSYGSGNDLLPLLNLPLDTFLQTEAGRERAIAAARDSRDETS